MASSFKKLLLTGTALVAVSAFGAQARAAASFTPATSVSTSSLNAGAAVTSPTPAQPAPASPGTAGAAGNDTIDFGANTITVTVDTNVTAGGGGAGGNGLGTAAVDAGGAAVSGGLAVNFAGENGAGTSSHPTLMINSGETITGSNGGNGGNAATNAGSAVGGAGSFGVGAIFLNAGFGVVTDNGTLIKGGDGGNGGTAILGSGAAAQGGAAGGGNYGIRISSNNNTVTLGSVTGGKGGNGGTSVGTAANQGGGTGSTAVFIGGVSAGVALSVNANAAITGGNGGNAGTGGSGAAGVGGGAGPGITVSSSATPTSLTFGSGATVTGGTGGTGAGGNGTDGQGILLNGTGTLTTFTNNGATVTAGSANSVAALEVAGGYTVTNLNNAAGTLGSATSTAEGLKITSGSIGTLTNAGTVTTGTGYALNVIAGQTVGDLENSGTISSTGASSIAVLVNAGAKITTFDNKAGGVITAAGTNSLALGFEGLASNTATNAGTISAPGSGAAIAIVYFSSTGNVLNNTGGTITSGDTNASFGTIAAFVSDLAVTGGTVSNTATGGNALYLGATAGGTFTLTNVTVTGNIAAGANAQSVTLAGTSTLSGAVDLGAGANSLTLNNTQTLGTGNTFKSTGGTLDVSVGAAGAVTVNTNETDATLQNLSVASGGSLALNANYTGTGTLSNSGALSIAAGKTLTVASASAGAGSAIHFGIGDAATVGSIVATGGGVNLTNTVYTINFSNADAYIPTTTNAATAYKIAHGTAGATVGAGTVTDNSALLTSTVVLGTDATIAGSANDLYVKVTRAALSSVAGATPNELAAGTALDSASLTGSALAPFKVIEGNLAAAPTPAALNSVVSSTAPTVDGSAQTAALGFSGQVSSLTNTHLAALRTGDADGMAAGSEADGTGEWLEGFGSHQNQDTRDTVAGYSANTWGGAFGADSAGLLDGGVIGVGFSFGDTTASSSNVNTTSTAIKSYGIDVYGSTTLPQDIFLNGQIGYAFNAIDQARHNVGGAGGPTASATYHSQQLSLNALAGRDCPAGGGMTVTPSVSAAYTYLDTGSYTETGSGANESVGGDNLNNLGLGVGVDAGWKFKATDDGAMLKPSLHAGYTYEALDDRISTTSSFIAIPAAASFRTQGADPARSIGDVGAKLVLETVENWDLSAAYDFQVKSDFTAHSGWIRASTKF